jgi:hypothetical protein
VNGVLGRPPGSPQASPAAIAHEYAKGFRAMSKKLAPVSGLVFLLAAAAFGPGSPAQAADLKIVPQVRSNVGVAGATEIHKTALARPAPASVANLAGVARVRFSEARAAMARGLQLNQSTRQTDIATLEARMTSLFDELTAVEQLDQSRYAGAAREARRLADDWYQTGLRTIDPPADGLTELPLPMLMSSKADAVVAALDRVTEQSLTTGSVPKSASLPKVRHAVSEAASLPQASLPLEAPGQRQ